MLLLLFLFIFLLSTHMCLSSALISRQIRTIGLYVPLFSTIVTGYLLLLSKGCSSLSFLLSLGWTLVVLLVLHQHLQGFFYIVREV